MKNSIEEDIKIVENYLANSAMNEIESDFFKNGGWEIIDLEIPKSMQHILSDYKRVLQENEKLKAKLLDTLEGQKVIKEETPQYIKENYISKEKIEDKISKLEYYIQDVISKQITMLQETLKESEE